MIDLIIPYFSFKNDVGFLQIKKWVILSNNNTISNIWIITFYIHVFTSMLALIAGFTQFYKKLLYTRIHRTIGKIYILTVIFLASPSGFIIGFLANGGIIARMSFVLLALLWWHYTYMSYKYIKQKQYELHAKYMFISYALTLSAITLRLWKFIIVNYIYEIPPMELYRIISWLGWVPNLIIARILIRKKIHLQILK